MNEFTALLSIATGGLWALALARLTRLIVADRLTDFLRVWAYRRSKGAETYLTYFLQCPWCVSMWLGFGTAWVIWWHPAPVLYILAALAASYLVGLMASNLEPDDDIEVEIEDD